MHNRWPKAFAGLLLLLLPVAAMAQVDQIAETNALASLTVSIGYMLGIGLFVFGLYSIYEDTNEGKHSPIKKGLWFIIAGTLMMGAQQFYNSTVTTIDSDLEGSSRDMLDISGHTASFADSAPSNTFSRFIPSGSGQTILRYVFVFGLIGFLRGIYMLKDLGLGGHGQKEASVGKALTHIIGGALAMNITEFSCVIAYTIGHNMICLSGGG